MRPNRLAGATIVVLLFASPALAQVHLVRIENSGASMQAPEVGLTPGSSPAARTDIAEFAYERIGGSDLGVLAEVESATRDVEAKARGEGGKLADEILSAGNASNVVQAVHRNSYGNGTVSGVRTNLTLARTPAGLVTATAALYAELGLPLTYAEQLAIEQQVALLPPQVAVAGALATFATLDAMHLAAAAQAEVALADRDAAVAAWSTLELSHRGLNVTIDANGNGTITFDANETAALEAAAAVNAGLDRAALVKALDVLAQAVDEIDQLPSIWPNVGNNQFNAACSPSHTLYFVTPDCLVIIGDAGNQQYYQMSADFDGKYDKNMVLVDVGGNELYQHRAGGATPSPWCGQSGGMPVCSKPVQLVVDLGAGNDRYDRKTFTVRGAAQGSGEGGVGVLFDEGGNDRYQASHNGQGFWAQGAAFSGGGLLFDKAGDDLYEGVQRQTAAISHAQGVGALGGIGIAFDAAGRDERFFNLTGTGVIDGGGAQGFGTLGGAGVLIDLGAGFDLFRAEQDRAQAAALLGGYGYLLDVSGGGRYVLEASTGCPDLEPGGGGCAVAVRPLAAWSRGFADTLGFAALFASTGDDAFEIELASPPPGAALDHVGLHVLGVGRTSGVGLFVDRGGRDVLDARVASMGYGLLGVGIFSNVGGVDEYQCPHDTCYAFADEGVGVFYDGVSAGDTFADGEAHEGAWTDGTVGVGYHDTG